MDILCKKKPVQTPDDKQAKLNKSLFDEIRSRGNPKAAQLLIDKGASVKARDEDGNTPMHIAVGMSEPHDYLEVLLKNRADVKARDKTGWTPLHNAAARGAYKSVTLLIKNGAEVSAKTTDGRTPLHIAINQPPRVGIDERETIDIFIKNEDTDLSAKDDKGRTPIDMALDRGQIELARTIEAEIKRRQKSKDQKEKEKKIHSDIGNLGLLESPNGLPAIALSPSGRRK